MSTLQNTLYEEAQKESIIEGLTYSQEEILKERHSRGYMGTDDNMPDAYERWLEGLSLEDLQHYLSLETKHD